MANNVAVLLKKLHPFEKKESPCYLGLPPKPVLKEVTRHDGEKTVNWLTKPSGIKRSIGSAATDPMTPEKWHTLMGG